MKPATCPTPEKLSAYVLGKLPDKDLEALAMHASDCPDCQSQLQRCDAAADSLVLQIQRPPRTDTIDEEPSLRRALQEAQTLVGAADFGSAVHPGLTPAHSPNELGRLGPYRVLRQIGAGGMGMVYEGEDPSLRRRIALKVMVPALADGDGPRQRFLREARAMAALTHDHIIPIYQVGEERGVLFLAMPFLEGETLHDRLKRVGQAPGRAALPLAEVLRIGREIAEGLEAAHSHGLIHRDVKPSNIWLEAGRDRVKILDFGLARALASDAALTQTGNLLGTPEFMSPEQANCKPVDARSDLFSLGSVLYLLCTGVSPFRRGSEFDTVLAVAQEAPRPPREINPELPPAAADLILDLMAKDPARRPSSARAVVDELDALDRTLNAPARPRRRFVWFAAAAAVVLAVAAVPTMVVLLHIGDKTDSASGGIVAKDGVALKETIAKDAGPMRTDAAPAPVLPRDPADDAFCKAVAAMPPRQQLAAVMAKLKELNPGFDGAVRHLSYDTGAVWRLEFSTDAVTNIAPVRALPALTALHCMGSAPDKGKLADLSPLRGTKLTRLEITNNNQVRDLSPLRNLPMELFWFDLRADQDLTPLREIKTLRRINTREAAVFWTELSGPKGKP